MIIVNALLVWNNKMLYNRFEGITIFCIHIALGQLVG
jgi:hypothetical protein